MCFKKERGKGFRKLRDFNLAMSSKQGWNLITKPDSLVTRLLKAVYYPHSSFLLSKLGHNQSYAWRGIWSSIPVLEKRCRWRIGNGCYINPWTDPWLRRADKFTVETPTNPGLMNLRICDLWILGTRNGMWSWWRNYFRREMPRKSLEYR